MKSVIDNITEVTGWSGINGATVHGLNSVSNYIAGNNLASVIFSFNAADAYIEKTYGTDVTDYDELTFWITSFKKGKKDYQKTTDYLYKIDLGVGKEYYLKAFDDFFYVTIDISDVTTIDRIRITALQAGLDYIILSYCVAFTTVLPLDVYIGIKEQLEYHIDQNTTLKNVGLINGTIGDDNINFGASVPFLDRYTTIKIDDGVNSEIHHVDRKDGNQFYFSDLYDGSILLNDYTNADVYLYYPIHFGTTQREISLPSITLWGFAPERLFLATEFDNIIDTVKTDDTFGERRVGQYLQWSFLIDCEAKEEWELLGELSNIVRTVIGQRTIWVNGRKANIEFDTPPTELYPTEAFDIMPKIQYPTTIIIREELYERSRIPKTTTINFEATII